MLTNAYFFDRVTLLPDLPIERSSLPVVEAWGRKGTSLLTNRLKRDTARLR